MSEHTIDRTPPYDAISDIVAVVDGSNLRVVSTTGGRWFIERAIRDQYDEDNNEVFELEVTFGFGDPLAAVAAMYQIATYHLMARGRLSVDTYGLGERAR